MTEEQRQLAEAKTQELLASNTVIAAETKENLDVTYGAVKTFLDEHKEAIASGGQADTLWEQALGLIKTHAQALRDSRYMITLKTEEFSFINKVLTTKLVYNRQDIFIALRVKENFLSVVEFPAKATFETFGVDIDTLTLLSYLIGKYEHQGLDKNAIVFANVVENLANISRVFEHYKNQGDAIMERAQNWVAGLEPEPEAEAEADAEAK
jgi:hypothetical protein